MKRIFWLTFFFVLLPLTALAQVVNPETDFDGFVKQVFEAVRGGNWRTVAVLGSIGAIYYLRKYGIKIPGKVGAFLTTSRGGAILALVFGILLGTGTALLSGQTITLSVLADIVMFAFTSIGGWVAVRRILGIDGQTKGDAAASAAVKMPSALGDVAKGLDPR